jgi:hypothetical protein
MASKSARILALREKLLALSARDFDAAITTLTRVIDSVARNQDALIAVIYDDIHRLYSAGGIPENWVKVGWWTIPNNNICYNETVYFYAIKTDEQNKLRRNLIQYAQNLPEGVTWGIIE